MPSILPQVPLPSAMPTAELAAASLEATITGLLSVLCLWVWQRTRERHFGWWSVAFALYALRLGMIMAFLGTMDRSWLFWHQVITGWTAVALLWAALVFANRKPWGGLGWVLLAFPPLWSYIAVERLESFTLAAVPAVLFISGATLWTGYVLLRHRRPATRSASTLLGWSFVVWGLHHLDYPVLRAQGAWLPWGYYLDILFVLAVGSGVLLLVNADLASRLQARSSELERLSQRMVRQHEEERKRLSMALHDETAQVFAGVKLQLGVVREQVAPAPAAQLDRALELLDQGIKGVRSVTHDLRPALLDDLGLLPALRSLVAEFGEQQGLAARFAAPETLPVLGDEAELAIFRAVQESLTNVTRHAPGARVDVTLAESPGGVHLLIADDGPGLPRSDTIDRAERDGHLGISGMRERITALGGTVRVDSTAGSGVRIVIDVPAAEERAP
jgi:signal transduction histidine kinase